MRILLTLATMLMLGTEAFSQSFQWDQSAALKNPGDQLVNSIVARLLLSREVAWAKFCNHAKVRDLAREAKVLTDLKEEGRKLGLTPEEVSRFFKPQIAASCRLQEEMIMGWSSGLPRPATPPKDLPGEIRPLIDKLDRTLLLQWKAVCSKSFDRADFYAARRLIEGQGISADVANIAAQPLLPRSHP